VKKGNTKGRAPPALRKNPDWGTASDIWSKGVEFVGRRGKREKVCRRTT